MSAPACWLCGHQHRDPGAYGCQAQIPYGATVMSCDCPLKTAYAADPTKTHRAGVRPVYRRGFDQMAYETACACGWEGLSYWKRRPATEERDGHLREMAEARAADQPAGEGTG